MGISLVLVIVMWLWFGHIGPSYSAGVLQEQQATLRKQTGFPAQQTSTAELEVPPSLRGLENITSTASNTTGGNHTAESNQTAANATGANNQTSAGAIRRPPAMQRQLHQRSAEVPKCP